jgi:hypothetical protein
VGTKAIVFVVGVFVAGVVELVTTRAGAELLESGAFDFRFETALVSAKARMALVFKSLALERLFVSDFAGGRFATVETAFVSAGKEGRSGIVTPARGLE